ncbi:MAG: (2Fe-2S)-binding protein [Gemmatimonas sp.]|jgi:isoquinoline 1-oxidoreductase alpha subunit|uniref:(2Fe-2S)-binding protein n=1 Tax=Gemmatimonas sp. TaxID=1962908 RepID=UPI00391F971B|nr:(2Fe-2S)-binding protein [Gemmatimonadota bacterium]
MSENTNDAVHSDVSGQPERTADSAAAAPVALSLTVNGALRDVAVAPETPLLWALRQSLGLTGTKFGCGMSLCGACTVHVDGVPTRSCVTPVSAVVGRQVTTIEGVSGPVAEAVQGAWVAADVPQCGYCQSGQVMAAAALLSATPQPSDAEIDAAMRGNVCRCGTYPRIRAAIRDASARLSAEQTAR